MSEKQLPYCRRLKFGVPGRDYPSVVCRDGQIVAIKNGDVVADRKCPLRMKGKTTSHCREVEVPYKPDEASIIFISPNRSRTKE